MNTLPGQGGGSSILNTLTPQQLAILFGAQSSQIAALTGSSLSTPLSNSIASVSQQSVVPVQNATHVAVESKPSIAGAANTANAAASDISLSSLPWPVVSPVMNVPHFDLSTYRLVNLDVAPSRDISGLDLPLSDVTTLRFFFNLGVQHSRSLAATQLYQEKLSHVVVSSASGSVTQPAQAGLSHVTPLAGVSLLPSEAQVASTRIMDTYLNLGLDSQSSQLPLLRGTPTLQQHLQLLAATARPQASYGSSLAPLHSNLLQMPAQVPVSVSAAVPGGSLIRQQLFSSGNPSSSAAIASNSTVSSLNPHKQIPPHSAAAEQQAFYLQQALSAVANAQNEKPELEMHSLQQPGSLGLHPYVRPASEEVLKPVAVGGGSQDAAISPRPPPVDPSPPRTLADASTNFVDSSALTLVHQQAQTSPPVSREPCTALVRLDRLDNSQVLGAVRPQSAREQGSALAHAGLRSTPQNSAPATPALTADDVVPVSQTLFQVSEQHFTEAFNATRKKSASNPIGIAKCDFVSAADTGVSKNYCPPVHVESSTISAPVPSADRKEVDDKPALAPILMMTYLNNCMSNIKSTLNTNGLPVGLDANGRAVDYSSRPIDPIFQQARARMENAREFRELSPPTTLPTVSRSSFEEGSGFSPIGVALPTVSSTTLSSTAPRPQMLNTVGVNRAVPDALIKTEEAEDSLPPAEKRPKMFPDGE